MITPWAGWNGSPRTRISSLNSPTATSAPTAFWATPCCSPRTPLVPFTVRAGGRGSGGACGNHARGGAAVQSHLWARAGIRAEGRKGHQESGIEKFRHVPHPAQGVSGEGRCDALAKARALVESNARLTVADRDRLFGFLEGTGIAILPEPEVLLTATPRCRDWTGVRCPSPTAIPSGCARTRIPSPKKLKAMQTDPARARRTDPGDPDKCPVWDLHKVYSNADTQAWVQQGCRTAGIGCLDCKAPLIEKIVEEGVRDNQAGPGVRGESRAGTR